MMDEYTAQVFDFLNRMPYDKIYTVDRLCKAENRDKFIHIVKRYMDSYPYQGGVSFLTEKLERFRKIEIPEAAMKALNE